MTQINKDTWVIGNWKSNPTSLQEAKTLATDLKSAISNHTPTQNIMVMPTAIHLSGIVDIMQDSNITVGCQDISFTSDATGAYTGDCSAQQMNNLGAKWTLVGHSERRLYHQESAEQLLAKIEHALAHDMKVVLCIGETLSDYENDQTLSVLQQQLSILQQVNAQSTTQSLINRLIIAYEPVWAIGTGKVAEVAEVESVHQHIHQYLLTINSDLIQTPIIYGGSVNDKNIATFANSPSIDGVLVGGASLIVDKFVTIANTFFTTKDKIFIKK